MPSHARFGPLTALNAAAAPSGLVLFSSRPWVRNSGVVLPRMPAIRSRGFQYAAEWFGSCCALKFSASQPGGARGCRDPVVEVGRGDRVEVPHPVHVEVAIEVVDRLLSDHRPQTRRLLL